MLIPPLTIEKPQYHSKLDKSQVIHDVCQFRPRRLRLKTTMRSACIIVPTRCATIKTVDSVVSFFQTRS